MPKLRVTKQSQKELKYQFGAVDDDKLRLTLSLMADKYSEGVRQLIYSTYTDPELNAIYRNIRNTGMFQKGAKDKSRRLIVKYPNGYVFDFINTVMSSIYDNNWMKKRKALRHELIRPWHVVSNL